MPAAVGDQRGVFTGRGTDPQVGAQRPGQAQAGLAARRLAPAPLARGAQVVQLVGQAGVPGQLVPAGQPGPRPLGPGHVPVAVPVLMPTARAEEVDRVIGLEVGADDYLTKPFGTHELIARVRALLRRFDRLQEQLDADRAQATTAFRLGPLELDPAAHTVRLDGAPLELTRTEFGLLHLLLRNRGRLFNRSYLHDAVWGEPAVEGDRSVDNAVLRLRRKLGPLGDAIETVWGVGYRFTSAVQPLPTHREGLGWGKPPQAEGRQA